MGGGDSIHTLSAQCGKYMLTLNLCFNTLCIPYSWKIWRGIIFGDLAVYITTTKLKSAKISCLHIYVWRPHTEPPNLNPLLGSIAKFNSRQYFRLYGRFHHPQESLMSTPDRWYAQVIVVYYSYIRCCYCEC